MPRCGCWAVAWLRRCCALLALIPLAVRAQASHDASPAHFTAAVDSLASRFLDEGAAPGVSVVVVRDTQIVYLRGFGFADLESKRAVTPDTRFYIASATKSFTGFAVALLDLRGIFRLESAISRFIPDLRLPPPLDGDSITVRDLLTHTHGISDGTVSERLSRTGDYRDAAELIRLLAEHSPNPRGRAFSYGNIGYNIVSFAMERVVRESWKTTVQRLLFTPLAMTRTSTSMTTPAPADLAHPYIRIANGFVRARERKGDATMHAAGGIVSTARDMAAWLEIHINGGSLDGRQVFPREAVVESHRPLARVSGSSRGTQNIGYGLGWQIGLLGLDTLLWHGGAFTGYAAHMSFIPEQRLGVVVMANEGTVGRELTDSIAYAIYRLAARRR